jgi:hypothetical protein
MPWRCMLISTEVIYERSVSMGAQDERRQGLQQPEAQSRARWPPSRNREQTPRRQSAQTLSLRRLPGRGGWGEETEEKEATATSREQPSAQPTDVALLVRTNQDRREGCFEARSLDALLCLRGPGVQDQQVTVATLALGPWPGR